MNWSLPECLELATFTTSCTDEDSGETNFHGQCELSTSPGAYFSNSVGVEWSCWSESTPRDLLNDGSARDYGFDGACNFRDWYRALKPNDLPECDHVRTDCSPGASWFVDACYSAESEAWLSIQRPDQVEDVEQQQEVVETFCSWRLQGHSHPRIGRRKDVRRSMLLRREKSGCILVGRSGGFVRILQDGTAKWKKGATTSTSSPRARSDDRDDDEDPFYVPGIADEPRERRVRRQPSQPLNSSLLECTDLPSFKHRGDGSV